MPTTANNNRKRRLPRYPRIFLLGTIFLLTLVIVSTYFAFAHNSKKTEVQAASSFSFTAAGDYGQTNYTTANLNYIKNSGVSFNLALGDSGYDSHVSASAWSTYAKSNLRANFPFEILDGRHDTSQINTYAANLPNHIGTISGTYAKQYAFDYPQGSPLARFILISPTVLYNYSKGSANYTWVSHEIDSARSAGIHWVIVGMHQYCFTIDSKTCPSQDLLDLLLNKKVDLILQAQKHSYQASKQLALSSSCPMLNPTSYNAKCVVNSSTSLTRGAGSVIVVTGTGGTTPLLSINTSDPKIQYFRKWMGSNVNQTFGLSQFTISSTSITEHFVGVSGSFSDSFTING
ncbi:MAG: hypothetical protein M3Z24_06500 [Chloroflexota bacterium]|nr:hypothetical protein [Chloroflexota bacterium]